MVEQTRVIELHRRSKAKSSVILRVDYMNRMGRRIFGAGEGEGGRGKGARDRRWNSLSVRNMVPLYTIGTARPILARDCGGTFIYCTPNVMHDS